MEDQRQIINVNDTDLQNNLSLAIKIVKNGAPAIADEINAAIVNVYNEAVAKTSEVAELQKALAECDAKIKAFEANHADDEKEKADA